MFCGPFVSHAPARSAQKDQMETPTDTGSVTTGPATFAEVSWTEAPSASTPDTPEPSADTTPADATVPPAETDSVEGSTQAPGEPPKERWDAILSNAREKARTEAMAEWQDYAWVKQMPAADFKAVVERLARTKGDPIGLLTELVNEVSADPTYGPQLRSLAAKQLAAGRGQQTQTPDLTPTPIQLEDGRVVQLYSADQIAALKSQWMTDVEAKLSPRLQTVDQMAAERQAERAQHEADQFAGGFLGELSKLPHFEEHKAAIHGKLAAMQLSSDHPAEVKAAAYRAYVDVLQEKVLPSLSTKAQTQLLDTLQTKAAASTSVNPGSAAPTSPRKYNSFHELPAEAWK